MHRFFNLNFLLWALLCFLPLSILKADSVDRPNILFCIADDWSYGHAGVYGDPVVATPNFDRVAKEGILFHHAFSAAPSCTPSRAAILTGRHPHQLEEGGLLHAFLPQKFSNYVTVLKDAGYHVGHTSKGWGPGRQNLGGYEKNPAGPNFRSFDAFLAQKKNAQPFCFWLGSVDPHRPYETGSGAAAGLSPSKVRVPAYWPDNDVTRGDVLDYYAEVQRFDQVVGSALSVLEKMGQLDNTIIVITADNGMPFPRCKANLYDGGTRQPLAVRWGNRIKGGQVANDFINLLELAPTFVEAAGIAIPSSMYGKSFLPLLLGKESSVRKEVLIERERHAYVRDQRLGYPSRALRDEKFLYIRNYEPDRWPAGDPVAVNDPNEPFGDVDAGLIKSYLLERQNDPEMKKYIDFNFGKRPAEELYEISTDPDQVKNLAGDEKFASVKASMSKRLEEKMAASNDRRLTDPKTNYWDKLPYFGGVKGPITPEKLRELSQ